MKFLSIVPVIAALSSAQASVALRGNKDILEAHDEVSGGWEQLKCMLEGKTDKTKCSESVNPAGDACSFCTLKDDTGNEAGLCVDPEVAPTMEQMNPQITCDNVSSSVSVDEEKVLKDYHDFKCSVKGFTDPEKCSHMRTDDGKHYCQYCTMDGPFGEQGICVSPEHAKEIKHISPTAKCSKEGNKMPEIASNPVTDCNLSGKDIDTCLDPLQVNGSECIWCDAGIGGFCFPKSWSKTAGRFLDCKDNNVPQLEVF
jgi:hypothetical protein